LSVKTCSSNNADSLFSHLSCVLSTQKQPFGGGQSIKWKHFFLFLHNRSEWPILLSPFIGFGKSWYIVKLFYDSLQQGLLCYWSLSLTRLLYCYRLHHTTKASLRHECFIGTLSVDLSFLLVTERWDRISCFLFPMLYRTTSFQRSYMFSNNNAFVLLWLDFSSIHHFLRVQHIKWGWRETPSFISRNSPKNILFSLCTIWL